ncbi:MAG: hypothetical protein FWH27_11325 [Planctomycetaceae bacterium]|nr:hypothetical protein [Planctomycetaceae bacterium]
MTPKPDGVSHTPSDALGQILFQVCSVKGKRLYMRWTCFSLLMGCLGVLVCLSGCQRKLHNPDGRMDVSGKITFNGGPFEGAEMCAIAFVPVDEPSLGSSSTTFNSKTGKYLLTFQDGLKPGKYRVSITAQAVYDRKTNKPVTAETLEGQDYRVTLVPPEFNKNSTIEYEVEKGKKNVFDYDVKAEIQLP